ncbi:TetR/AcrR family transcriptional regulator [Patulibacter sp.]|uniref:TetR/AcrR family transcriptional regulator n=1 Tax=Patulibacter sp. TaxID=1912859 RepID=UPI0027183593|nr:TetR/AcrR family transcriptional regulator [Patulibacter sp.]MDO9407971.1 TetR/AcrR family transcriptional regulator [Patulibacter sp.]
MAAPPAPRDLRAQLLRAAEDEIAEVGLAALSLRAIARRAGVSHQTPGHIFRDRAGLFTAVAQTGYDALAEALQAGHDGVPGDDAPARLTGVGVAYVRFALERGALFAILTRPELSNLDDPGLAASRARPFRVLHDAVEDAVAGGWGGGAEPRALALLCWSTVHGLATLARDGILAIDVPEATPEELATLLSSTLVAAMGDASQGAPAGD